MCSKLLSLVITLLAVFAFAPMSSARIFLTGRNYLSGEYAQSTRWCQDFNNDGVSDIASANQNDKNVSVFLENNGNGTFNSCEYIFGGRGRNRNRQRRSQRRR